MAAKSTKRKKSTKSTSRKKQQNTEIQSEIIILATLAASILLVLSNFGAGGIVGEAVSSFFFGLFGFMAYILPFLLFCGVAFQISNRGNAHAYIKIAAAVALFLVITAILELLINQYDPGTSILSYYRASSEHKNAGGLTGGCIISLFCPLIGEIGTYVVLFIIAVICIILISERTLLAPLGRKSKKAYEEAKRRRQETAVIRAKEREEQRKERKAAAAEKNADAKSGRRADKKVSGVSFATTLTQEDSGNAGGRRRKRKSPEVQELSPDMAFDEPASDAFSDNFVIHRAEEEEIRPTELFSEPAEPEFSETAEPTDLMDTQEMPLQPKKPSRRKNRQDVHELTVETENVAAEVKAQEEEKRPVYHTPPLSLLKRGKKTGGDSDSHLKATAAKLEQTLRNFGVGVHVTNASCGPSVTRYELQPEQGVKVSRIVGLADDIKLNLAVADLRIEAPIPGKAAVGIEVPNSENTAVMLRDLLESKEFQASSSPISFAVGKDISGKVIVSDIAKMPHLLVADRKSVV